MRTQGAEMCDTMGFIAGDTAFFAKNSDRSPNEPQVLEYHPARTSRSSDRLKVTYTDIPDSQTDVHAVLLSRPTWMWGAEIGVNDCGVCIGNEAVFTRGAYGKTGLTGMDLVRLGLERSDSAAHAMTVITGLLEEHGQGGDCGFDHHFYYDNSFLIMDRKDLVVLDTAGRHWVAKRYDRAAISNRISIGSDGTWCDTATPKGTDFAKRHLEPVSSYLSNSAQRNAQVMAQLRDTTGVKDLIRTLRSHAPGDEHPLCQSSVKSVCMHAGGLIGDHTTASMIVDLSASPVVWVTGSSTPCIALFKPWGFGDEPVPPVFQPGDPGATTYWLQHERFHRNVIGKQLPAEYYAERDALEQNWLAEAASADRGAMHALSLRACVEEAAFYEKWQQVKLPIREASQGFKRYWEKKNALLG